MVVKGVKAVESPGGLCRDSQTQSRVASLSTYHTPASYCGGQRLIDD